MIAVADKQMQRTLIIAKIGMLNERLKEIPEEITTLEIVQRETRTKAVEIAKKLQEEKKIKESADSVASAQAKLREISRHIAEKKNEQVEIMKGIEKLKKELEMLRK